MIIVLIILTILAVVLCIITIDEFELISVISGFGAIILGIIDLVIIGWCIYCGMSMRIIDDKIKMYEEENIKIEEQMTTIVQNYQGYEEKIIHNIADMEVALIRFPELKTSELVKKQMDVYVKNNNKIKELKEEKINNKTAKWLLYFGK